jgi:SsrA-binding protein
MALATNKKAYHEYKILETFVAGIVLTGAEVKSVKAGRVDLKGSFAALDHGEVWLKAAYIAPYSRAKRQQTHYDPNQDRKLLLRAKEIKSLIGKTSEKGVTLVPLKVFNKKGLIKLELGLGKGKKKADKRESIKQREFARKKSQMLKSSKY